MYRPLRALRVVISSFVGLLARKGERPGAASSCGLPGNSPIHPCDAPSAVDTIFSEKSPRGTPGNAVVAFGSGASPQVGESVAVSVVVCTQRSGSAASGLPPIVAAQSSPVPFEVVVVDNGSEDSSATLVREWALADPRIRSVREPAPGLSIAKNVGLLQARGQLVLFTDDDIVLAEGWIAAFVSFFAERPEVVEIAGGPYLAGHDLGSWPSWVSHGALADLPRVCTGRSRACSDIRNGSGAPTWRGVSRLSRPSAASTKASSGETKNEGRSRTSRLGDRVRAAHGHVWYLARSYITACPGAALPRSPRPRRVQPRRERLQARTSSSYVERAEKVPATQARSRHRASPVSRSLALLGRSVSPDAPDLDVRPRATIGVGSRVVHGCGDQRAAVATGACVHRFALLVREVAPRLTPSFDMPGEMVAISSLAGYNPTTGELQTCGNSGGGKG